MRDEMEATASENKTKRHDVALKTRNFFIRSRLTNRYACWSSFVVHGGCMWLWCG